MTAALGVLIKLGIRLVVFGAVFWVATRKNPRIVISNKWTTPLIALVFAAANTALYALLTPVLNLATLGTVGFFMPFIVNLLLLLGTIRVFQSRRWLEVQGVMAAAWLAGALTLAHGVLYVGLQYLPNG